MSTKKISELPAGTADPDAVVPATNATLTATEKIALGDIRDLPHAANHQTGGADAVQNVVVYSNPDVDGNLDVTGADIVIIEDVTYQVGSLVDSPETAGRVVLLHNRSGSNLTLLNGNVVTASLSDMTLPDGGFAAFMYDADPVQWKML